MSDIDRKSSDQIDYSCGTKIDQKSKEILIAAIKQVEKETGKIYELSVRELLKNSTVIYKFDSHGPKDGQDEC